MDKAMLETVTHNNECMAMIIRSQFKRDGVHFFTPDDYSQQLAYMSHPTGKIIQAHIHQHHTREVHFTQEVLVIRKGILEVDFYSHDQNYLESRRLFENDVILLASGGHGFKVIEAVEMIEIKQGPYCGEKDKIRFEGRYATTVEGS